jgi:hypothetical protein
MADPRLFKITRKGGEVTYGGRIRVAAIASAARLGWTEWYRQPKKIEAVANADLLPWQDVTKEFLNGKS